MISLKSLQSPQKKAMVATFVGQGGIGKTSLAASFPACVWIPIENLCPKASFELHGGQYTPPPAYCQLNSGCLSS